MRLHILAPQGFVFEIADVEAARAWVRDYKRLRGLGFEIAECEAGRASICN